MTFRPLPAVAALGVLFSLTPSASASFHLMQIEQVIGGVYGNASAQAIQLRMRSSGQDQLASARIRAFDANGNNPVVIIDFSTSVTNSAVGDRILVTSAAFNALTTPAASADYTMTSVIPSGYLAAGSLTFETNDGLTIYWRISWGGGSYTGPTTGASTNDNDGNFGSAINGALPTADARALLFRNAASAKSAANQTDYNRTSVAAIFTNNARTNFTITVPTSSCAHAGCERGDLNADCVVDMNDLNILLLNYNQSGKIHSQGDTDGNGFVDIGDLGTLLAQFGSNCN